MATSSSSRETFDDSDTRHDEMHSTIEAWIQDLVDEVDDAVSSEQFTEWLDVQSRFHDYSHRNTLLIKLQCPHATRVAGYRTWQNEFDRHVKEGETAIWIWAPIIAKQCPDCGNSPSYHERSDCEYNETPPDSWEKGLVGFRPAPVFDISQTDGEPLPDLETEAKGQADELVPALLEAADPLEVDVELVPPQDWSHGSAKGICESTALKSSHASSSVIVRTRLTSQSRSFTSTPTRCYTVASTTRLSDRNVNSRLKRSAISLDGTSSWIQVGQRSTSPRGTVTSPKRSSTGLSGSVRLPRRSSTSSAR